LTDTRFVFKENGEKLVSGPEMFSYLKEIGDEVDDGI